MMKLSYIIFLSHQSTFLAGEKGRWGLAARFREGGPPSPLTTPTSKPAPSIWGREGMPSLGHCWQPMSTFRECLHEFWIQHTHSTHICVQRHTLALYIESVYLLFT